MKYNYFVGLPHQRVHSHFIQSLLGGKDVNFPCDVQEAFFSKTVFQEDSEDTVWFFNDIYFNLHDKLKGKQVLVGHGLGLGWFMTPQRVEIINRCFDAVFETGYIGEARHLDNLGVQPSKIKQIGYTLLFDIPPLPAEPGRILFFSTHFKHWNQHKNLAAILRGLDESLQGVLTLHPQTPPDQRGPLMEACEAKKNVIFVESQEELLKEYARCACAVGQLSSVMVPFYYQKKPVIFLRGRVSRNPLKGIGWEKIRREMGDKLFDDILTESTLVADARSFGPELVNKARYAPSSAAIFYPQNYDKELTARLIHEALEEIAI